MELLDQPQEFDLLLYNLDKAVTTTLSDFAGFLSTQKGRFTFDVIEHSLFDNICFRMDYCNNDFVRQFFADFSENN